jgi:two-component system, chemotaxis family, CheB/CheR fusion protein
MPDEPPSLETILTIVRSRSRHEFGGYKRSTLLRRIHRRMGLNDLKTLADYAELLRANPAEIKALIKDLMISVTGFFRDPKAWEALDATVLAPLVAERKTGAEMRFWVPACASGEEAYSLAMLALERAEAACKQFDVKIFATDPQEDNLRVRPRT